MANNLNHLPVYWVICSHFKANENSAALVLVACPPDVQHALWHLAHASVFGGRMNIKKYISLYFLPLVVC